MYSENNNHAFTMAELMVCLAIIAIISTMLIPTLASYKPNRNKTMFKKAYNIAERIVNELVNDEDLYPPADNKSGFDNVEAVDYNGTTYSGGTKFCGLFADKVNIDEDELNCGATNLDNPSFITNDGVYWVIANTTFDNTGDQNFTAYNNNNNPVISIDVNGDKAPNCKDGTTNCTNPDRFDIYVRVDGKMKVTTEQAMKYLGDVNMISKN